MYSDHTCIEKLLLIFPVVIIQGFTIFAIYGYYRYYLNEITSTSWRWILTLIMTIMVKLFETHYFLCVFINPGDINPIWSETNLNNLKFFDENEKIRFLRLHPTVGLVSSNPRYNYCFKCRTVKPERTHHCSACNRCYLKMEHHCPWVGNCIGFYNHKYFICTLFYGFVLSAIMVGTWLPIVVSLAQNNINGVGSSSVKAQDEKVAGYVTIFMSFLIGVVLCLTTLILLVHHLQLAFSNMTSVETHTYSTKVLFTSCLSFVFPGNFYYV